MSPQILTSVTERMKYLDSSACSRGSLWSPLRYISSRDVSRERRAYVSTLHVKV